MNKLEPKFGPTANHSIVAALAWWRFVAALLLAALLAGAALSAAVQQSPVFAVAPGQPFAIADFDGDLHPDLASVQVGVGNSSHSVYWIQLQLTAVGRQSIRLIAPVGGLQLLARDVNGDHAIDLVVMTASLGEPVAVFLNDGHGGFSRADKNAFSSAFGNSALSLTSPANSLQDTAGIPPQSSTGLSTEMAALLRLPPDAGFLIFSESKLLLAITSTCHLGRAPPSRVSLS